MRRLVLTALLLTCGCATLPPARDDPGVRALLAFDRAGERGGAVQGLADPSSGRAATLDDPVRIASISKLVVAVGVLRLVEQGQLELDADVSRWLGWPLRNPAFPDRPVTLRMLLSHTGSVRDHDDQYAIPLGRSLREVMTDPNSWDGKHGPGDAYFAYSNMNFPIVASVMERATGERFDRLMRRLVLEPMKLDACFNWPTCSDSTVARAIVLTQGGAPVRDDLHGRRPPCPVLPAKDSSCDLGRWTPGENGSLFAPQGGLRISVRDLAKVGRMLLGGGSLDGTRILLPASVEEMLRPQWRFDGSNGATEDGFYCSYGLAAQQIGTRARGCNDDAGGDGVMRVGHAGEAYGLRSGLWIDRSAGAGIAYIRTDLADATPNGRTAFRAAEEEAFRAALALLSSYPSGATTERTGATISQVTPAGR